MPQKELQKQRKSTLKDKPQVPRKHKVFIINDDFTTFDFVIMVMMEVFRKTMEQAEEIATVTHIHHKACVGEYSLDIARSKVAKATAMARAEGFPLKFEIE